MLTASEVAEKRKARRSLAHKQVALEEAVERRSCECIYNKIWQHEGSLDRIKDERLRSRTAGLALLGISMKDLGVDIDPATIDKEKQREAREGLTAAQECLIKMNDEKYPLGKLRHLVSAHSAIVETLTKLLPSTSSADEILPTLIYALITSPTDNLNVISNLLFIQRFRSQAKLDGEAAYCLTNLEAAINFVENVDLPNLRDEEDEKQHPAAADDHELRPSSEEEMDPSLIISGKGNATTSMSSTPAVPEVVIPSSSGQQQKIVDALPGASPFQQQRRLGDLFQPPAKVIGAANDAVRNAADQSLKNIGATLDSSLNLVLGRLKGLQPPGDESNINNDPSPTPKSVDEEARHLATPASFTTDKEGQYNAKELVDADHHMPQRKQAVEDRVRDLVIGRDRSVDSSTSTSLRSVSAAGTSTRSDDNNNSTATTNSSWQPMSIPIQAAPTTPATAAAGTSLTPFGSMRSFSNSFNPLNHIPGMIKSFGRSPTDPSSPAATPTTSKASTTTASGDPSDADRAPTKLDPPIQRFLDTEHADDLKLGDVSALLRDYKRLAFALFKQSA